VDTWVIVLIVVVVVALLALLALLLAKRSRAAGVRKREQAREHLQEAHVRGARADREQAAAEEQAAAARRELAETRERAALAEQEARERAARAGDERAEAEQLRARAEKLAPDLSTRPETAGRPNPETAMRTDRPDPRGDGAAHR
jgi:uncharacterized protein (DUF3084 family)